MKNKNPLYLVKGKDVLEVSSIVELVVKKFNLEPVIKVLNYLLKLLFEQVKTFESFIAAKKIFDGLVEKYQTIAFKFGLG